MSTPNLGILQVASFAPIAMSAAVIIHNRAVKALGNHEQGVHGKVQFLHHLR